MKLGDVVALNSAPKGPFMTVVSSPAEIALGDVTVVWLDADGVEREATFKTACVYVVGARGRRTR